ncbi:calpain-3 isoform X2 [Esox lucius]|uniref:Calpain catalytic domain-containing protein n=2 Tax=Esox lucius TaxID=8010 RepID=A0A6Q2XTM3_ESOLU|nr:calpain-3 isoform X2 [Esox lucius]
MSDRHDKKSLVAEKGRKVASTDELGATYISGSSLSSIIPPDKPALFPGNLADDVLFLDRDFPMGDLLLQPPMEWRRPKDICPTPQFIVDGATRMDVCQGVLNDCWFLSAVASLSMYRPLLERVVPVEQSFQKGYDGSFYFRFWQYGEWEIVKVDDLLPTQKGKLIYLSSSQKEEFWSALLEKAYAKLKGGYLALNMGFPHEAMVDMTGGVTEVLTVASLPMDLAGFLKPLLAKGALVNCANCQGPLEQQNEFGILFRHAYSVTGLENVKTQFETVELIRVHNPWGKTEWQGRWSDMNGPEWRNVHEEEQQRLGRVQREDGEFWMLVSDFRQNFDLMEVCHLSEQTLNILDGPQRPWQCTMHHGSWVPNLSAGGPASGSCFWQNPQFHLTLLEEDDDPSDPELTCSFLVALMQKHERLRGVHLAIGLDIYEANSEHAYLSPMDLRLVRPLISTNGYAQRREVVIRGRLAPGNYVIIPSTTMANQQGEFILRVLTEKGNNASPAQKPSTAEKSPRKLSLPHLSALPSDEATSRLFTKHCNKGVVRPLELLNLLTEAIKGGVLTGSEKKLALEHCKSFVVLMDSRGLAQLDWPEFQALWDKIRKWTDIFLRFDENRSQLLEYPEISPALKAAGMQVDDFVLQLIGQRYTEPDMTISYPGFLYLLMKLDSMIHKFQAYDIVGMGTVSVNYRQWLHLTMYN